MLLLQDVIEDGEVWLLKEPHKQVWKASGAYGAHGFLSLPVVCYGA